VTTNPSVDRRQAVTAALQWGIAQAFLLDSFGRLADNYYRATTNLFVAPSWVTSIQFAVPLGLLVGGYGGYRWLRDGYGATTPAAHAARVRFSGALFVGWALAIVPVTAFRWLLGEQLFTVPYFLLPSLVSLVVFGGAFLLAYRTDSATYDSHRDGLLGATQGVVVGLVGATLVFLLYGEYLTTIRESFSLDGGPFVVAAVVVGGLGGFVFARRTKHGDRAAEFLTLFFTILFAVSVTMALTVAVFAAVGVGLAGFVPFTLYPLLPLAVALGLATYLTYRVRTDVYRRLVGAADRRESSSRDSV
jgi:MFS family permease